MGRKVVLQVITRLPVVKSLCTPCWAQSHVLLNVSSIACYYTNLPSSIHVPGAFEQEAVFRGHTRKDRRLAHVAAADAQVAALLGGDQNPDGTGDGAVTGDATAAAAEGVDEDAAAVAKVAAVEPLKGPDLLGDKQLFGVYIELITELLKAGDREQAEELLTRAQDLANMRSALAKAKLVDPLVTGGGATSDREGDTGVRVGKPAVGKARLAAIKSALGFCDTVAAQAGGEVDKVWKKLKPLCTR